MTQNNPTQNKISNDYDNKGLNIPGLKILGYDNIGRAGSIPARGTTLVNSYSYTNYSNKFQKLKKSLKEPCGVHSDATVTHDLHSHLRNLINTSSRGIYGARQCRG
jgi:hypothetical protein